jgi:integrase
MPGHTRQRGKRKDGTPIWQARWRHPTNRSIRRERNFESKRAANKWLTTQEHTANDNSWSDPKSAERPFKELWEAYDQGNHDLQPASRNRNRSAYRTHIEPHFANQRSNTITAEQVQGWIDRLHSQGTKPGTIARARQVLSAVFTRAVDLNILPSNPAKRIKLPHAPKLEQHHLTTDQVETLANAIEPHYQTAVLTAAYTGLRAGELWALRKQDFLINRRLVVQRSIDSQGIPGPTKNHERRSVPLPSWLAELIAQRIDQDAHPDDLIFTTPSGTIVDHRNFRQRVFRPAVIKARDEDVTIPPPGTKDRPGLRWHDLRHTFAAWAIEEGAHLVVVKKLMGHESIDTTERNYGHLASGFDDHIVLAFEQRRAKANGHNNVVELAEVRE